MSNATTAISFSHWNYRLRQVKIGDTTEYEVVEVYYDSAGNVVAWAPASLPVSDDVEDILGSLRLMVAALEEPTGRMPLDLKG